MLNRKWLHVLAGVVMFGVLSTTSTGAIWDAKRTTYFTFSRAVQIPGATLPAGSYVFERADANGPIDLVRVLAKDRSKVYLTAFTHMVDRPRDRKLEATIVLGEASANRPPAIKVWYPEGECTGHEFIY